VGGCLDGWMGGWIDGWMDGCIPFLPSVLCLLVFLACPMIKTWLVKKIRKKCSYNMNEK